METDTNENVTFVELQTIKKDELFCEDGELPEVISNPPVIVMYDHSLENSPIVMYDNPVENSVEISYTITGDESNPQNDDETCDVESYDDEHDGAKTSKKFKNGKKVTSLKISLKLGKVKKSKGLFGKKARNKMKEKKKKRKPPAYSKDANVKSSSKSVARKPKCEYPRLCSGCGHAYKTKQSFWNHKQRCPMLPENNRNNAYDENGLPIEGAAGDFVRRKEYICAHCERRYRKKYNLQEHLKNNCRGKPCSKGRLQCWVEGCTQAFYKYVDLVQHVTLQHGQDLQIQKLQFPNLTAFNSWKTEESNSKFMYARKITGSKRFSNTRYHYFVCQFNHRNEKKNSNRKTNRRKNDSLVVPNYNCPSRIMVKECDNQIHVTYISSHNHELNLSNVKYQPLEKEARAYIKTLLQLGVSAQKIKEHLQEGVGNPEIDSFLTTKQHFLTLNRIKRMESKLKAKNRARELEAAKEAKQNPANDGKETAPLEDSYSPFEDATDQASTSAGYLDVPCEPVQGTARKQSDDVVRSIETNLKKLKGYMHKSGIKEKLSDRISKMIQELCNECENVENSDKPVTPKKSRISKKKKPAAVVVGTVLPTAIVAAERHQTILQPLPQPQTILTQHIMIQHQQPITHQVHQHQAIETFDQPRIVNNVVGTIIRHEKSFTPAINEATELLKPIFQPYNINLLCLKSLDRYITDGEQMLLKRVDEQFTVGWLCDAVVNSFLNLICHQLGNVIAADTSVVEYVLVNQKLPEMWHCFNWNDIDTIFIPCNPSKKYWILLVWSVKQPEFQILDPSDTSETVNIYKKHSTLINCWFNVLRNFLNIVNCGISSPPHAKHNDPGNSGVLVSWYVFQYVNKLSLLDSIDTDVFRQYMFNTIVSNSTPV